MLSVFLSVWIPFYTKISEVPGYDIQQIARAMCSDINLIALKVDTLIAQGYQLRKQEHQNDFLKYSKKI